MHQAGQALTEAASALQRVAETQPGQRGFRASVVALVLNTVAAAGAGSPAAEFMRRRAAAEVTGLPDGQEKRLLTRLLGAGANDARVGDWLNGYSAALEESRRLDEAWAVIGLASALAPERAGIALRAGRIARLRGDTAEALRLYRLASDLDGGCGTLAHLAAVGEATVNADPEHALSVAIRRSIVAGDAEAAAVGLEERARVRRAAGDRQGAARDLAIAAARYPDAVDRARAAHHLADLFVAADDPGAAREALLFALEIGDSTQRDHALGRLHTVARDMGDQIGMRRWRSFKPPALVSLSTRSGASATRSSVAEVARWRRRLSPSEA